MSRLPALTCITITHCKHLSIARLTVSPRPSLHATATTDCFFIFVALGADSSSRLEVIEDRFRQHRAEAFLYELVLHLRRAFREPLTTSHTAFARVIYEHREDIRKSMHIAAPNHNVGIRASHSEMITICSIIVLGPCWDPNLPSACLDHSSATKPANAIIPATAAVSCGPDPLLVEVPFAEPEALLAPAVGTI